MTSFGNRLQGILHTLRETEKNRFFITGILFGGLFGLLAGSLVAFQVGSNREAIREVVVRRNRHNTPQSLRMV